MNLKERDYIVYIHTNKINGKKYVGVTCQEPNKRWLNGKGYSGSHKFYNAIKKYGWDGFYHDIIHSNLTQEQAGFLERELIEKYNTTDSEYGYNIQNGGFLRGKLDKETKQKISESKYKKVICVTNNIIYDSIQQASVVNNLSPSSISSVCGGKTKYHGWWNDLPMIWFYYNEYIELKKQNIFFDDEIKEYLPLLKQEIDGYNKGENSTSSVSVVCLNTKEIFPSIKSACDKYGFSTHANIVSCCTGKSKSCGTDSNNNPLIWRYESDYLDMINSCVDIDKEIQQLIKNAGRNRKGENHPNYGKIRSSEHNHKNRIAHSKEVICNGETFLNGKEFAEKYGLNYNTVRGWLNGNSRIPQKYADMGLRYKNENIAIQSVQTGMKKGKDNHFSKKVICDGIVFDTISQFALSYNITLSKASKWLRGETRMPQEFKDKGLSYYN